MLNIVFHILKTAAVVRGGYQIKEWKPLVRGTWRAFEADGGERGKEGLLSFLALGGPHYKGHLRGGAGGKKSIGPPTDAMREARGGVYPGGSKDG